MSILHIIQHSLGVDQHGQGNQYRDRFVTEEGSTDYPDCMEAVRLGLMDHYPNQKLTGGMDTFIVNAAGKAWMAENSPPPPKPSAGRRRYRQWLDADCSMSFIDFCRSKTRATSKENSDG